MLLLSKDHLQVGDQEYQVPGLLQHVLPGEQEDVHGHELRSSRQVAMDRCQANQQSQHQSPQGLSQFLPTTQKLLEFSNCEVRPLLAAPTVQGPKKGDRIVYVAGAFDLFHIGHLAFLEKCREHGDYLIVGLHTDPVVNR